MIIDISKNTKRLRKARHLSQSQVAKALHMDVGDYKKIENGDFSPSYDVVMELSSLYNVPVSKIHDKSKLAVDDLLKKFVGPSADIIETDTYIEFRFNH